MPFEFKENKNNVLILNWLKQTIILNHFDPTFFNDCAYFGQFCPKGCVLQLSTPKITPNSELRPWNFKALLLGRKNVKKATDFPLWVQRNFQKMCVRHPFSKYQNHSEKVLVPDCLYSRVYNQVLDKMILKTM